MKKNLLATIFIVLSFTLIWGQTNWIEENIQTWTSQTYGNHTQIINVGNETGIVNMIDCQVLPAGDASGTGSLGFIQMRATVPSILEFPEVPSVSSLTFNISAFGAGRSVQLQAFDGVSWNLVATLQTLIQQAKRTR